MKIDANGMRLKEGVHNIPSQVIHRSLEYRFPRIIERYTYLNMLFDRMKERQ